MIDEDVLRFKLHTKGIGESLLIGDMILDSNVKFHCAHNDFLTYRTARIFFMNVFVDVSEEASAAIAYIVNVSSGGREIALISPKTENGPKKPT